MISLQVIKDIKDTLIQDEMFCRLVAYGQNPYGDDKDDIVGSINHKEIMGEIIYFAPQIPDLQKDIKTRVCLFKSYSKISYGQNFALLDNIEIDIYVPHTLMKDDYRVYDIEDKIVSLIDDKKLNALDSLEYVQGNFVPLTPISGYVSYKMTFAIKQGRSTYGRY